MHRFGVACASAVMVLAIVTILEIDLARPSGALPPSFQVLPATTTFNAPDAVFSDGSHVWVANKEGNSVTELDASTGAVVEVISGAGYGFDKPDAIASDGTNIWVANSWGNSVTEFNASTTAVVKVISAGTPPPNPYEFSPSAEFDFPFAITVAGNHVWVVNNNPFPLTLSPTLSTNNWSIAELDASTGALIQLIQGPTNSDTDPYTGIAYDGTHVWVTNSGYNIGQSWPYTFVPGYIQEFDNATGSLVQTVPSTSIASGFLPNDISFDGTHLWVMGGASLAELSASTGAPVQVISFAPYGLGIVDPYEYVSSDSAHVWVKLPDDNLVEFDASTGAFVQEVTGPHDGSVFSYDGTHVWVVGITSQGLTEFDAATGSLVQVIPVNPYGFNGPQSIASDGRHVWVFNGGGRSVTELDAVTGAAVQVLSDPGDGFGSQGSIASDGVHVWVANFGNASVTELDAATGALVQVIPGISAPWAITADGTHVWVADAGYNAVTELDAATGAVVQVISDAKYGFVTPQAISSDGTHVWVVNGARVVGPTLSGPSITELDAATGALVQVLSGPSVPSLLAITSDGTHVWGAGGSSVTEFDASTGSVVQSISAGLSDPQSVSSDGTDVWVASTGNNEVMELDASTGTLVQVLSGAAYGFDSSYGISSDGTEVWVANTAGQTVTELSTGTSSQRIFFTSTPPPEPLAGSPPYTVSAIGGLSGNPVTFSIDPSSASVCTISGATVSFVGPGTCTIDANQAAGNGYVAARQAQQSFVVGAQRIVFTSTPPTNANGGSPPYTVSAVGGASGNPVTFSGDPSTASVCTVSGSTVSFVGPGTCTVDANQAAGNGYVAAPQQYQSFVVGAQTITFTSTSPSPVVGGPPYTVTATGGGSGNPVTFSSGDPADCLVSGSTVSFVGAGWCDIYADQAGNADFSAAPTAIQSFYVNATGGIFAVTTPTVPAATIGVRYPAFALQASGAPKPYKWTLTQGQLPQGIHLRGSGVLRGRPSRLDAAGDYSFTVVATTRHRRSLQTTPPVTLTLTLQP